LVSRPSANDRNDPIRLAPDRASGFYVRAVLQSKVVVERGKANWDCGCVGKTAKVTAAFDKNALTTWFAVIS
jgi:hypothetical protein